MQLEMDLHMRKSIEPLQPLALVASFAWVLSLGYKIPLLD
jgi:hypothetical protein